ncbi:MAG: cation-translocating P-type ATPase [Usitatibacter sp.]
MIPAGLTTQEARRRLLQEGPNVVEVATRPGLLRSAADVLREPMFMLLLGAAGIYVVLGDVREAMVLASSMVIIVVITVLQRNRTERALESLRDLSSPRALVIRDGKESRIPGAEVVRGDLFLLREGDRIAADGMLVQANDLQVDESLVTGESVPVAKTSEAVLAGTLVARGTGQAIVTATGAKSELGKIGNSLATVERGKTTLEREIGRIVAYIATIGIALCLVTVAGFAYTRADLIGGILAGLTLAMALVPEEFPVVLTVFLALGAWRISRHGVLTRQLAAIELLGETTVLCCDKTGTLTENRMRVTELFAGQGWRNASAWSDAERRMLDAAALACETSPFDPMERAIRDESRRVSSLRGDDGLLDRRYPLTDRFLAVAHGWKFPDGTARLVLKGAPESVIARCSLPEDQRRQVAEEAASAAQRGLRVLAVAEASSKGPWLESPDGYDWRFLGLVALADPVRASVPAAIALCRRAGIRVVMITGDHPATAREIARQAGLDAADVVTGAEIAALDDAALDERARRVHVFARVRPEQKLRLVQSLRRCGEIVAMTGDGVNDAPALKAAHIGVAMGRRGTDVAREAASLILLDDDFTALVGSVRLGRRIYDNLRNAMRYLVAVHVPLAGMAFFPLVAGWPILLFPVHVVFLEFVIDPACSLVFEAERSDANVMERPPRDPREPLFSRPALATGVLLGVGLLVAVALVLWHAHAAGRTDQAARTMAFVTLVTGNIALIFANRSHALTTFQMATHENRPLWLIALLAAAALLATIYVPAAAHAFRFEAVPPMDTLVSAAIGAGSIGWYDFYKIARRAAP